MTDFNLDLSLLDSSEDPSNENIKRIFEQVVGESKRNFGLISNSSSNNNSQIINTGVFTTCLTGKHSITAGYTIPADGLWHATDLVITIPADGKFIINTNFEIYGSNATTTHEAAFELRKNGVVIPETVNLTYLSTASSNNAHVYPCQITYTDTFAANDIITVYLFSLVGTNSLFYDANYGHAFIQYTQLQSNIPVVATLGQDAYVSPWLDLTVTATNWASVTQFGKFYKDSSGNWSMKFVITGAFSSGVTAATSPPMYVTGVLFPAYYQGFALMAVGTSPYLGVAQTDINSNVMYVYPNSSSTGMKMSGEVRLAQKPVGYSIPANL